MIHSFSFSLHIESTDVSDDVLANFAKRIGNIMPWDIGFFPNATQDSRFQSINTNIYEQYEKIADKSAAMSACLKNPQCPWVFDEKCDGIGPFIVGFRAKTTYNCPSMGMTMSNGQECSDNCLYEKGQIISFLCNFIKLSIIRMYTITNNTELVTSYHFS